MIFSSLNSTNDFSLCPSAIRRAVEYLKTTDFFHMEPGDYPIEGNLMYVKVFDQTSIPFEDTRPEKPITYRKVVVKVHMDLMKNSI